MQRCVIGYKNWCMLRKAQWLASAQIAGSPVTNLADPQISKRLRIPATAGSFTVDFGSNVPIDVLSFIQPWDAEDSDRGIAMLASTDTVRHQLDADGGTPGAGALLDTGDIASGVEPGYGLHAYFPVGSPMARYWKCSIDGVSLSQSFLDIGSAWAAPLVRPTINPIYGFGDEWQTGATGTQAPRSGVLFVDESFEQRELTFQFASLTEAEGRGTFKELSRVAASFGQIFFALDPSSQYLGTEALIGELEKTSPISPASFDSYSQVFTLKQSL